MKNKLLVIFLFALISIIIIYSKTNKKDYTLYIGNYDNYIDIEDKINNKYNNLNKYLFEKITYKELINAIKNNDYIVIKDKKIYLQQLINNASYIIIDIDDNNDYYLKELKILINRISYSKIIIIDKNS